MGNCATKSGVPKDEASLKPLEIKEEPVAVEEVKKVIEEGDDVKDKKEQEPAGNFRRSVSNLVKEIVDNVNCATKPKVLENGEQAPIVKDDGEDEKKVTDDGHDAKETGGKAEQDAKAAKPETTPRSLSNLFENEGTDSSKAKESSEDAKKSKAVETITAKVEKSVTVDEKTVPSETGKKIETQDNYITKATEEKKENNAETKKEKTSPHEKKIEVVETKEPVKASNEKKTEVEKNAENVKAEVKKVPEEKKAEDVKAEVTKVPEEKKTEEEKKLGEEKPVESSKVSSTK